MSIERREFIVMAGASVFATVDQGRALSNGEGKMYGLIGKMVAVAGKREELLAILLESVGEMPGCLSYIIAKAPTDENAIWITEVWDSEQSHKASLSLPAVKQAIAKGRPLIASFGDFVVTEPLGGYGLTGPKSR